MADLIALHWGPDEITAAVPAKGRDVRAVSLGVPPAEPDPAALGRWLRTELAAKKISGKRAAVLLPRSSAVFRKLALPEVPDDELPDLVRMQAATKSPTPLDKLRLDFVPLPRRGEGREVLLATIPAKTADDVVAAVRAAGLEPASVGLAPFATAARMATGDESILIVAVQGAAVEITLVRGGSVLFSHTTELQGGDLAEDRHWLLGEVSRAVVAADHLSAAGGIARVLLIGPSDLLGPLAAPLAERYGGRAEVFDSPESLDVTSAEGVAPAALAAVAGQFEPAGLPRLDFLNPRKRVEKPDRRRLQIGLAAAGVAAVFAVAYGMTVMARNDLEEEIANLNQAKVGLDAALKRGEPTMKARQAVDAWLAQRADWVGQFKTLDAALPGTDQLYLKDLHLEPGSATGGSIGHVRGVAFARDRYVIERLWDDLAQKGYQVLTKPITESNADPQYPARSELDLTIPVPKAPASAARPSAASAPAAPPA